MNQFTQQQIDEMVDMSTVFKAILVLEGKSEEEAEDMAFQFLQDLMEEYDATINQ